MKLIIYSDGGARGNHGPAGIGAELKNEKGQIIAQISEYLGVATNNQAEYKAIIRGLEEANKQGANHVEANLDSELVVKQLNGEYKVKNSGLAPLFLQIHDYRQNFKKIEFKHIKREFNKEADKLANEAMNRGK